MDVAEFNALPLEGRVAKILSESEQTVLGQRDDVLSRMTSLIDKLTEARAELEREPLETLLKHPGACFNSTGAVQDSGRELDMTMSRLRQSIDHHKNLLAFGQDLLERQSETK